MRGKDWSNRSVSQSFPFEWRKRENLQRVWLTGWLTGCGCGCTWHIPFHF